MKTKEKKKTISIYRKIKEKIAGNKEISMFIILFIFFSIFFYLLYYVFMDHLSFTRNITAAILGFLLSPFGETVVNGAQLSFTGFSLEIIDECTAIFSAIVYCSCVLAYPTTLKKKGIGIAFGIPCLYAINIFRLVILAFVGVSHPGLFEFVHVYLWQASFIIFVVVVFLLWLKLLEKV